MKKIKFTFRTNKNIVAKNLLTITVLLLSMNLFATNPVTITPITETSYTVGVSEMNASSITVYPVVIISASSNPICEGTSTTLTASGDSSYVWSGGLGISNPVVVSPTITTTYTVTGTASGYTSSASITIIVHPFSPVIITASSNPICLGSSTTLTAAGDSTYAWHDGTTGMGTSNTVVVYPVSSTTYTVTGTNAYGCTTSSNITINVDSPPSISISESGSPLCIGTSTTLTAGGGVSYLWSGGLGTSNPLIVSPTSTTSYTVTGTDASGCTNRASITVYSAISISASHNPLCSGSSSTLTAYGGTTYLWSGGLGTTNPVTISPTTTTTYKVTGTISGCTGTAYINVNVFPAATVSVSASANPICPGSSTTLTAAGDSTYYWEDGSTGIGTSNTVVVYPTSSTTYTVIGTNVNGCKASSNITINVDSLPNIIISESGSPLCSSTPTTLTASGGVSYLWSGGLGTSNPVIVSPTSTTTYTVTGTNTSGCTNSASITVYSAISISASHNPICSGSTSTLTASGGTTYLWSGGLGTTNPVTISPTATTTYTVTGTISGCTGTADITVNVFPAATVSVSASVNPICPGSSTTLTASGDSTYYWEDGSTGIGTSNTVVVYPTSSTTYTVIGTNVNGCKASSNITISTFPSTAPSLSGPNNVCVGSTGNIYQTDAGMTNYDWLVSSGGVITAGGSLTDNTATITWNTIGAQTVKVNYINLYGCTSVNPSVYNVTVDSLPLVSFILFPDSITPHLYYITYNVSGHPPLKYLWSWGDGTYDSISYPSHIYGTAGFYTICLSITDAENCSYTYCDSFNLVKSTNTMIYVNVIPNSIITGINNNYERNIFSVYPNPANDNLTIKIEDFRFTNLELKICDIVGNTVLEKILFNKETIIDVSGLARAVYFVRIKTDKGVENRKFVKE